MRIQYFNKDGVDVTDTATDKEKAAIYEYVASEYIARRIRQGWLIQFVTGAITLAIMWAVFVGAN